MTFKEFLRWDIIHPWNYLMKMRKKKNQKSWDYIEPMANNADDIFKLLMQQSMRYNPSPSGPSGRPKFPQGTLVCAREGTPHWGFVGVVRDVTMSHRTLGFRIIAQDTVTGQHVEGDEEEFMSADAMKKK